MPDNLSMCYTDLHEEARRGIALFNQRAYFDAHEALEAAWRAEPGPLRALYQGILQVGVAYYHIQKNNYSGALKMFSRCEQRLAQFPAQFAGIDLDAFRRDYRAVRDALIQRGPSNLQEFPEILLRPLPLSKTQR